MAPTLQEYYNTGDDTAQTAYDGLWLGQTFTVGAMGHTVTSIKLLLYRYGSPGTVTVSVRAVDESGHPTGSDLTSGTTDGNTLTTNPAGELREITVTQYPLSPNTKYAVVVRAPSGTYNNCLNWRIDSTSPTYTDGNFEYSGDSGSTWTTYTAYDFMFEIWGVGSTDVFITESGSGTEGSVTLSASLTVTDTGAGAEAPAINGVFTISDSGLGTESDPKVGAMFADEGKFADFAWRTKPSSPMINDLALPHVLSIRIPDEVIMSSKVVQEGSLPLRKMVGKPGRTVEIQGWSDDQSEIDALDALRDGVRRTFYHPNGDSFGILVTGFEPSRTADEYNRRAYRLTLAEAN